MYTGFYLFGMGEVVPRSSEAEFLGAFCLLAFSQIANAAIIGFILTYMEELNYEAANYSRKLSLCNTAMINLKLSTPLKAEVIEYVMQTHHTKKLQEEFNLFVKDMTPSLLKKVKKETMKGLTQKNFILHTAIQRYIKSHNISGSRREKAELNSKAINYLVEDMEKAFTTPGQIYMQIEDECNTYPTGSFQANDVEDNEDA